MGAHTLGLARSVGTSGRVLAFEPADFAFAKLQTNLALNPELSARTEASQVLLADTPTAAPQAEIYASWPLGHQAAVHPKHRGRLTSTSGASIDTLDHFVERQRIDRINVIKLDVDGHELPVLRGGLALLKRFRPILVMEMSPYIHAEEHNSFAELVGLLKDAGYRIEDAANGRALPLEPAALERLIPDGASINVVAVTAS